MFNKLKYKICSKYLQYSDVEICEKENGFTNIIIKHSQDNYVLVLHPLEEKFEIDREEEFEIDSLPPLLRHIANE